MEYFGGFWLDLAPILSDFQILIFFSNFEDINFYDHLDESPGSPLSYSSFCRLLSSVGKRSAGGENGKKKKIAKIGGFAGSIK